MPLPVDQDLVEIPAGDPGDETQFLSRPFVEGVGILALDHGLLGQWKGDPESFITEGPYLFVAGRFLVTEIVRGNTDHDQVLICDM